MPITVQSLAGRTWRETATGREAVERYLVYGLPTGNDIDFDIAGIPRIGDALQGDVRFVCSERVFRQGEGSEKNTVEASITYSKEAASGEGGGEEEPEEPEENPDVVVEECGWDSGQTSREFVAAADGEKVRNSAGDPFDTVPTIQSYAPVFTKIFRCVAPRHNLLSLNCAVNAADMTILGLPCPKRTLLCSVGVKRIYDDLLYKYRYTINLRRLTNIVDGKDIGWDVALVQAGMRAKDPGDNDRVKQISYIDLATGARVLATSPCLLDNAGYKVSETDDSAPYIKVFKTYQELQIPDICFSEN